MEIEHHQLDLRFDATRLRDPQRESRLSASLLAHGQRQLQLDMGAVIDALADTFENLPGFDRAQFVEACEGGVW